MAKKQRIDQVLVERQLVSSRSEAQRLVMAGRVRLGPDHVVRKPSQQVHSEAELLIDPGHDYVSRGAHKLIPALDRFAPDLSAKTGLDIGASTGGFTDVLLRRGVGRVYAVDVGYGQLHYRLRTDPRVICLERLNARYLTSEHIPEPIDILTADVSFISLDKILPACSPLLRIGAWIFALIKPQFEASREHVGKGGVVRSVAVRQDCIDRIEAFCREQLNWSPVGLVPSPIKGPKGNQEFIAVFKKTDTRPSQPQAPTETAQTTNRGITQP